ncbi:MAG: hypothetical protein IPP29_18165 [Bacteroidetes bacterium]|nr:hypothetical protein [Bacteroidota bacterium]
MTIPNWPWNNPVTLPANGCVPYTISGYYTLDGDDCHIVGNTATLNQVGTTNIITAEVCPTVQIACFNPAMVTYPDNESVTSLELPSTVSNQIIYIEGTFTVNQTFEFSDCQIYIAAGGQIIVDPNFTFTLDNTIIEGCGYMWQGIKLQNGANAEIINDSWIRDADIGLNIINNSKVKILQSMFTDCVRGVYSEPTGGCADISTTWIYIDESVFDMVRPAFLWSYTNQPAHGTKPIAGVELNNVLEQNIRIGKLPGYAPNQFKNMNAGIVIHNSTLEIHNTTFRDIQPDNFYTEAWKGSAAASTGGGLGNNCTSNNIIVKTILGIDNINNCYRGIYTDFSGLGASAVKILNVIEYPLLYEVSFLQTVRVTGCNNNCLTF